MRTQNLFIDCFSAYIICFTNISKFPYIEKIQFVDIKTINFDMTFADYVLFKNINLYGKKLFEEIGKNKIKFEQAQNENLKILWNEDEFNILKYFWSRESYLT